VKYKPYPKYKDSGVEWLGEVPEHWDVKRLKTSANYRVSNVDKVPSENERFIRLCNYTDVYNNEFIKLNLELMETTATLIEIGKFGLRVGDIVITKDSEDWRDIAVPALVIEESPDLVCGYHLAIVRPKPKDFFSLFLFRAFQSCAINQQFQVASTGVTRYGLPKSAIGEALFPIPTMKEQHSIAYFLGIETDRINTLVTKKKALIEKLKEKRTALISRTVTRGLPPDVAQAVGVYPHPKLKPSGVQWLGDVPESWGVRPIKSLVAIPVTDGPHETPEIYDDGVPFVSAEAINNGKINFERKRGYISEEDHQRFSRKYKPKSGDILMVKSGATTGRIAMVETDIEFNIWSPLAAIRCKQNVINRHFLYFYMQSKEFQTAVEVSWSYGTQQNIGMGVIQNLAVPVPDLAEQAVIAHFIDLETLKIDKLIEKVETAIERLREYRTALITAAVTGKIDLRETQA
jgi:type I restriction enzyme, S subunit